MNIIKFCYSIFLLLNKNIINNTNYYHNQNLNQDMKQNPNKIKNKYYYYDDRLFHPLSTLQLINII
jgi:hypothetical protein